MSATVIFQAGWSDFEEYSRMRIVEEYGKLYLEYEGHNVYQGDYEGREPLTQEEAYVEMEDWAYCEEPVDPWEPVEAWR